jgi:hypothetical protein
MPPSAGARDMPPPLIVAPSVPLGASVPCGDEGSSGAVMSRGATAVPALGSDFATASSRGISLLSCLGCSGVASVALFVAFCSAGVDAVLFCSGAGGWVCSLAGAACVAFCSEADGSGDRLIRTGPVDVILSHVSTATATPACSNNTTAALISQRRPFALSIHAGPGLSDIAIRSSGNYTLGFAACRFGIYDRNIGTDLGSAIPIWPFIGRGAL